MKTMLNDAADFRRYILYILFNNCKMCIFKIFISTKLQFHFLIPIY